jgi:hypothetical protein
MRRQGVVSQRLLLLTSKDTIAPQHNNCCAVLASLYCVATTLARCQHNIHTSPVQMWLLINPD